LKKLILLTFLFNISLTTNATVTISPEQLEEVNTVPGNWFFDRELTDSDEKLLKLFKPYYKRIGELGVELNDKGRCRYHTRKNLLKANNQNDWDCFFAFRGMLRDTKRCLPSVAKVFSRTKWEGNIKGRIRYVGIAPLPYRYTLREENGELIATVKLYYKNWDKLEDYQKEQLQSRTREGAALWGQHRPEGTHFKVEMIIVDSREEADFKVKATSKSTRGPYLKTHSINWSYRVFAHELGHMLGLDDEYDQIYGTLFGKSRCTNDSLMCSSSSVHFPKYYWYLIFRRPFCQL